MTGLGNCGFMWLASELNYSHVPFYMCTFYMWTSQLDLQYLCHIRSCLLHHVHSLNITFMKREYTSLLQCIKVVEWCIGILLVAVNFDMALFYIFGQQSQLLLYPTIHSHSSTIWLRMSDLHFVFFVWTGGNFINVFIFPLDRRQLGTASGDL